MPRFGRWLTVCGLTAVVVGLIATALVLRHTTGDAAAWAIVGPLLVAGLGGGMVTSPNMTLTLQHVPVGMAGAAGGAVQTAQRIGAAIGTAVLATIFYHVLLRTGHDYPIAVSDTLLAASGFMLLALLMALAEATRRRWTVLHSERPTRLPASGNLRTPVSTTSRGPLTAMPPAVCTATLFDTATHRQAAEAWNGRRWQQIPLH